MPPGYSGIFPDAASEPVEIQNRAPHRELMKKRQAVQIKNEKLSTRAKNQIRLLQITMGKTFVVQPGNQRGRLLHRGIVRHPTAGEELAQVEGLSQLLHEQIVSDKHS